MMMMNGAVPLWDGTAQSKAAFHAKWKRTFRRIAREDLGLLAGSYSVRSCHGGFGVLGEVILHTDKVYVQVGGSLRDSITAVMYRSVTSQQDYCGGPNCWTTTEALTADPLKFLGRFHR